MLLKTGGEYAAMAAVIVAVAGVMQIGASLVAVFYITKTTDANKEELEAYPIDKEVEELFIHYTLYSYSVLILCTHTLYTTYTVLILCAHTLYTIHVLILCTYILIHYNRWRSWISKLCRIRTTDTRLSIGRQASSTSRYSVLL
jgi:hypothetical protein